MNWENLAKEQLEKYGPNFQGYQETKMPTILMKSIQLKNKEVALMCLNNNGCDVNLKDCNGNSAMDYIFGSKNFLPFDRTNRIRAMAEVCVRLLEENADINVACFNIATRSTELCRSIVIETYLFKEMIRQATINTIRLFFENHKPTQKRRIKRILKAVCDLEMEATAISHACNELDWPDVVENYLISLVMNSLALNVITQELR